MTSRPSPTEGAGIDTGTTYCLGLLDLSNSFAVGVFISLRNQRSALQGTWNSRHRLDAKKLIKR